MHLDLLESKMTIQLVKGLDTGKAYCTVQVVGVLLPPSQWSEVADLEHSIRSHHSKPQTH